MKQLCLDSVDPVFLHSSSLFHRQAPPLDVPDRSITTPFVNLCRTSPWARASPPFVVASSLTYNGGMEAKSAKGEGEGGKN